MSVISVILVGIALAMDALGVTLALKFAPAHR